MQPITLPSRSSGHEQAGLVAQRWTARSFMRANCFTPSAVSGTLTAHASRERTRPHHCHGRAARGFQDARAALVAAVARKGDRFHHVSFGLTRGRRLCRAKQSLAALHHRVRNTGCVSVYRAADDAQESPAVTISAASSASLVSEARCSLSLNSRCVSSNSRAFSDATPMLATIVCSSRTSLWPNAHSRSKLSTTTTRRRRDRRRRFSPSSSTASIQCPPRCPRPRPRPLCRGRLRCGPR